MKKIAAAVGRSLTGPSGAGGRNPKPTSNRSTRGLPIICGTGWSASAVVKEPNANIRVGVAAARAAHIGNAALRSGKKVKWDDKQQKLSFAE